MFLFKLYLACEETFSKTKLDCDETFFKKMN